MTDNKNTNKKIAFLFLTLDNVNFPTIWENYFKDNEGKYTIYCHPKYPQKVTVSWLKSNIITDLVETGWGYIVHAYHNLLKAAYEDKSNYKFITISESCLPLVEFSVLYNTLMKNELESYIKFIPISNYDKSARIQVNPGYEKFQFIKHYARFCLSRHHTKILLSKKDDFAFFYKMHIGDEFFLTILYQNNKNDPNIKDFAVTYDNWEYVTQKRFYFNGLINRLYKKYDNATDETTKKKIKDKIDDLKVERDDFSRNPKSYTKVTKNDIIAAKHLDNFFWRKFPKDSNIEQYYYTNKCCLK